MTSFITFQTERQDKTLNDDIRLTQVHAPDANSLKELVGALFSQAGDYDALVNIEEGVNSLLKSESLTTAYFIILNGSRVGYIILSRYHSVEKGGLILFIDEIYVEEQYRRQGLGHVVMERITEIAKLEKAKALGAHTEQANLAGQTFFSQHGFMVDPYINFERPL